MKLNQFFREPTFIEVGDKLAKIDSQDYACLSKYKWYKNNKGYAYTFVKDVNGKYKGCLMHRMLMQPRVGLEVHHINHDPLDNRRQNLKICTHRENLQCLQKPKFKSENKPSSAYKGVYKYQYKDTVKYKSRFVICRYKNVWDILMMNLKLLKHMMLQPNLISVILPC